MVLLWLLVLAPDFSLFGMVIVKTRPAQTVGSFKPTTVAIFISFLFFSFFAYYSVNKLLNKLLLLSE